MNDEEMAEEYCNHLQSEMLAYTPENPRQQRTVSLLDVEEPILDYYRQDGLWNYALENEVIAWKEIVLPELKGIE